MPGRTRCAGRRHRRRRCRRRGWRRPGISPLPVPRPAVRHRGLADGQERKGVSIESCAQSRQHPDAGERLRSQPGPPCHLLRCPATEADRPCEVLETIRDRGVPRESAARGRVAHTFAPCQLREPALAASAAVSRGKLTLAVGRASGRSRPTPAAQSADPSVRSGRVADCRGRKRPAKAFFPPSPERSKLFPSIVEPNGRATQWANWGLAGVASVNGKR